MVQNVIEGEKLSWARVGTGRILVPVSTETKNAHLETALENWFIYWRRQKGIYAHGEVVRVSPAKLFVVMYRSGQEC